MNPMLPPPKPKKKDGRMSYHMIRDTVVSRRRDGSDLQRDEPRYGRTNVSSNPVANGAEEA